MNTFKEIVVVAADCTSSAERSIENLNELYTITYEKNGGNFASSAVIQETFSRHSKISLPTSDIISRTGYEFKGWYADSTFTQTITEIAKGTTKNVTVWAKWVVTAESLDAFDGSAVFENETIIYEGNLSQDNLSSLCEKLANSEYDFALDLAVAVISGRYSDSFTYGDNEYRYFLPMHDDNSSESYFEKCTKLKSIILPNMMQIMHYATFRNCTNLESVKLPDELVGSVFGFSGCSSLKNINIPENITSIGGFAGCSSLESILIPENVTLIGAEAFKDCVELKSITLPKNLKTIWHGAFEGCTSLESIEIPDGTTTLGQRIFQNCSNLLSIKLPEGMEEAYSFYMWFDGCTSLKNITIPSDATSIGYATFRNCTSLIDITIPDNVTSFGESAFDTCTSLESIIIPKNVSSIDEQTFRGCKSLSSVVFKGTVAQWNAMPSAANMRYYVPATKVICSDGEVKL